MGEKVTSLGDGLLMFDCPGCGYPHGVWTSARNPNPKTGALWTWNGDAFRPTFSPSIDLKAEFHCHSHVRDGKIEFLNDCTHKLAGQTVELPDLE